MNLSASTRTVVRSRTSRKLRRAGRVAGVVYGHGVEPMAVDLDGHELARVWHQAGGSALLDLVVDGGRPRKVLIKAVQISPRRFDLVHVDLLAVNMREKLQLEVPVELVGQAEPVVSGVADLQQSLHAVTVECLPGDIPDRFHLDISGLAEVGDEVRAGELELPAGVTLVTGADELVVKLQARRVVVEEVAPEAGAEAAALETKAASEEAAAGE